MLLLIRFTIKACFLNTHKNTSWPNNLSKGSICFSIYHKTLSHGKKATEKYYIYNFPKRKRNRVKHTIFARFVIDY
ncbi:UNVERIFIED_CONTAM: hypothetical protein NCL1_39170 [Trichonephila clavipes]